VSSDLGFALLIGLAGFKLTQFWKELMVRYGWYQPAWWKTLLSLVICLVLALTLIGHRTGGVKVVIGLGAAGSAAIWHALDTSFRTYRDKGVSEVMRSRRR
jgi:hypothetical protein